MPTWKGLVERTKQRLNIGDKSFKPTPNVRNPCMLIEAEEFARHMRQFRDLVSSYEKHMSSFLNDLPLVCRSNLPRVWESIEGTNMSEPVAHDVVGSGHPYRAGGDYDEVLMADTAEIMRRRVDGIIRPIDRWLESLNVVKQRMARVEELRIQVDARRRLVHKRWLKTLKHMTQGQVAALRAQQTTDHLSSRRQTPIPAPAGAEEYEGGARMLALEHEVAGTGGGSVAGGPTGGRTPGGVSQRHGGGVMRDLEVLDETDADLERQRKREDRAREALSQQRQLEAVAESYHEQERLVFEQLSGLVRDAAYFKSYVASSFLVFKDTMQATLTAIGACKRPLPGFSEREADETPALYGRLAPIDDLITSMPPIVVEGGRQLPVGASAPGALTSDQLHPSRLTAQPLQVAADDISAPTAKYEAVPAVAKTPSRAAGTMVSEPGTPYYNAEAPTGMRNLSEAPAGTPGSYGGSAGYTYDNVPLAGKGESTGLGAATFPSFQEEVAH